MPERKRFFPVDVFPYILGHFNHRNILVEIDYKKYVIWIQNVFHNATIWSFLWSKTRNILLLRHSQLIFGRFSSSSVVQTFDKVLTSEKKLRELAQTCSSNISECSQPWVLSNETNYICIFVSACDFWKDDLTLWSDLKILENWKQIQDLDCSL